MAQDKQLDQQFVVSKELIQLLKWLVEHEPDNVKKLVQQALDDGLYDEAQPDDKDNINEEMQQHIIDFFSLLESALHEVYTNDGNAQSQTMFPAMNHIDSHVCDHNTLAVSAAKASSTLQDDNASDDDAKEALCKALIKYWSPDKTRVIH